MSPSENSRAAYREPPGSERQMRRRLMWLMLFRALFTTLLLGATILVQWQDQPYGLYSSLRILYGIIGGTYLLTVIYSVLFRRVPPGAFALAQIIMDTFQMSLIVYVTGGYESVFSFLYLVVIIYSSIFLGRIEILFVAASSALQYGGVLILEYTDVIQSFDTIPSFPGAVDLSRVGFKIGVTAAACLMVALLSGLLSEQERTTRRELWAVREHMRRVQKMAAIGEMAARLAHEIKNPLAALVGSLRLLCDDMDLSGAQERLLSIVLRESDRLNNLVSEFLTFARPVAPSPEPSLVDAVVADTIELFKGDSARSGIELETDVKPDTWISMNPCHLKQVLWNLLVNAADAQKGEGRIAVYAQNAPDGQVLIRVTDDGPGMDEKTLQCLFEPFFTTKPQGTGLGLSIVHRILTAYGFRLDVESAPDEGATFTIVARKVPPPKPPPSSKAPAPPCPV